MGIEVTEAHDHARFAALADTIAEKAALRLVSVAETAAEKAVIKTLIAIGINPSDPIKAQADFAIMREVGDYARDPEFRKDWEHTRKWRLAIENVTSKGIGAAIVVLISGFAGAVWLGVKVALGK